jgi:hypothetical protein
MARRRRFATRKRVLAIASLVLLFNPAAAWAQALNACDLNADGVVNVLDIQLATIMALGLTPCNANITAPGVCNIVVIQRVTNAVLTGACLTGLIAPHTVTLTWSASTSSNVIGYNVYRGTQSGGPYTKLTTASLVSGTSYTDTTVLAGQTYYYVTTAVNNSNVESAYSNQAQAVVPTP